MEIIVSLTKCIPTATYQMCFRMLLNDIVEIACTLAFILKSLVYRVTKTMPSKVDLVSDIMTTKITKFFNK